MRVLGIADKADSGIAVIEDGKIIFAVNEERLTRKKLQAGFPVQSLKAMLQRGINKGFDGIAIAGVMHYIEDVEHVPHGGDFKPAFAQRVVAFMSDTGLARFFMGKEIGIEFSKWLYTLINPKRDREILRQLDGHLDLKGIPAKVYDHHYCHACSAYFTSGFDTALTVTIDAAGDGYCSRAYLCEGKTLRLVHSIPFYHSIGYYYTLVTFILGFKGGQQGKVTGLSARGNADKTIEVFRKKIPYNSKKMIFENRGRYYFREMPFLKQGLQGHSREDISAGIQRHLEESVTSYIQDLIDRYGAPGGNIALAGGVFANVLLNRAVARLKGVKRVFIHPHMGDGGLSAGAGLAMYKELAGDYEPYRLEHVYLGNDYSDADMLEAIRESGLDYKFIEDIETEIARLIAEGKVVARFEGPMEYGPRALGHRSILYHAKDPDVNQWLNKRLKRSEFMPFAPAVLKEYAEEYFVMEGQEHPAYFMTIVCDTTDKCKKECPAIVHVDGTARPQIVDKRLSPSYYKIIDEYRKLSGIPVIVNTSFNMHEEPIVCTPRHAIDAFKRGHLDCLAMGNYLLSQKE